MNLMRLSLIILTVVAIISFNCYGQLNNTAPNNLSLPDGVFSKSIDSISKEISLSKGEFLVQKLDYLYPSDHSIRIISTLTVDIVNGDVLYQNWRIIDKDYNVVGANLPSSITPQFILYKDPTGTYVGQGGANQWLSPQTNFDPSPYVDEMAGFISLKSSPFVLAFNNIIEEQRKAAAANGNLPLLAHFTDEKSELTEFDGTKERTLTTGPTTIKLKTFYDFIQSYSENVGNQVIRRIDNELMPAGSESLRPNNLSSFGSNNIISVGKHFQMAFRPKDLVLGVLMRQTNGRTVITDILPGSAASRSGLVKGEEILRINGADTPNMTDKELLDAVKSKDDVEITFSDQKGEIKRISIRKLPLDVSEQSSP